MINIAFGKNTVLNILESPYFDIRKVILRKEYEKDEKIIKILEKKNIFYQIINKDKFSNYNFDKKNQGIVAFIKKYRYSSLNEILEKKKNEKSSLIVILDSIEDPHNFGAILRTCSAFKVKGVIISRNNQVPVNNTVIKVSTGGIAHVPICKVNNLIKTIEKLKKEKYQIISTICNKNSKNYENFSFKNYTCIIFGNENKGINKKIIDISDYSLYIDVYNKILSLNVSVTCGIFLSFFSFQIKKNFF